MAGDEMQPKYWFSKDRSPQASYGKSRWWPHLVDLACGVGATYGVDPMQFVVHSEWINRPATVIVDKEGIVRLAYRGTFWGDRPSIEETGLEASGAVSFVCKVKFMCLKYVLEWTAPTWGKHVTNRQVGDVSLD